MTIKLYKTASAIAFILCVMAGFSGQGQAYEGIGTLNIKGMVFRQFASLVSQATGQNIIVSKAAGEIPVHLFLEQVSAEEALEAACRAYQCWYRKDSRTGIISVVTLNEYRQGMAVNDEELVKVVKLNHTDARVVGESIKKLFGDRVIWATLDYEQGDSDFDDLQSALQRMDTLADRTQFSLDGSGIGGGRQSTRGRTGRTQSKGDTTLDEKVEVDVDSEVLLRQLTEVQEDGSGTLVRKPGVVYVTTLKNTNSVLLRSTDADILSTIENLIAELDQPKPQVLIEVKLLEIELDDELQYGVDWLFEGGDVSGGRSTGLIGDLATTTFGGGIGQILEPADDLTPQGTLLDPRATVLGVVSDNVRARLQLLEQRGLVKRLATPNLCVADGEASRVFVGSQTTVLLSVDVSELFDDEGNLQRLTRELETERLNIGMSLLIQPEINTDESVTIRIVQEDSRLGVIKEIDFGDVRPFQSQDVDTRTVTTTIIAMNGQISAVGGLIREESTVAESGMPGAENIPMAGNLLKTEADFKRRSELLVLLRPYILRPPSESEEATLKFIDALSGHPGAQSDFPAFGSYSGNMRENNKKIGKVSDLLKNRSWVWHTN